MSHVLTPVLTPVTPRPLRVTQSRVLLSEWTKFRSLRSSVITLAVAVVLMVGLGAVISAVSASQFSSMTAASKATFDAVRTSLSGITFAQLAIGVLGVLVVSGEYTTGMIRATLTVVPRRLPVLWAKLMVFAATVFTVSTLASFGSFFLGQYLLGRHGAGVTLAAPGALRSVIGAALVMTVVGLIGAALGALLRTTAGGISVFVGAFFVITPLAALLPSSYGDHITPYLPSNAGADLYGGGFGDAALGPWTGFAVLCAYAVVLIAAAAWRLRRTDA